jgi:hypothetical protein
MRSLLLAFVGLALVSAPAVAEPVTLTGAPAADSDAITGSIAQARTLMAVCWQRKPPATVKVALAVAATGEVTKATAKTKGPAAQCAAGILAVQTLAPAAKAWKGTVELATASEDKAADARNVNDQLASHRDDFFACQDKAPSFAGKVKLRVTIKADGTVAAARTDVVEGDEKAGQPIAGCVAVTAKKIRFAAIAQESLNYDLTIPYAGGGRARGGGTGTTATDASLQPSKKGPLDDDEVTDAIKPKVEALARCAEGRAARGKVVIRAAIAANGKVTAKIKTSEINNEGIEGCLLKVFQGLKFRSASGETVVLFPVRLDDDGLKTGL